MQMLKNSARQRLRHLFLAMLGSALLVQVLPALGASVGSVSKVQNQAQVGGSTAVVGTPVSMNDLIQTGPNARLQITFRDNTLLTLGENARVVVDRYVYSPAQGNGAVAVSVTRGALRFATGKLGELQHKDVTVTTPAAALAVRGTDFWVGPINGQYGALLLKGKVRVSGRNR